MELEIDNKILLQAIAAANEGIIISDAKCSAHPTIYVNQGFERLTGYSCEEVIGRKAQLPLSTR